MSAWLPGLIELASYGGNWNAYFTEVYATFATDFVGQRIQFRGKRVGLKRHPVIEAKEATFWHLISEGQVEADRIPNMRRCERIGWPRAMIDNSEDPCLRIWNEDVRGDTRTLVFCEEAEYLLVLADRGDFVLPWTAYPVEYAHQRRKLIGRWQQASQNG